MKLYKIQKYFYFFLYYGSKEYNLVQLSTPLLERSGCGGQPRYPQVLKRHPCKKPDWIPVSAWQRKSW